jgi:hypothetical protein
MLCQFALIAPWILPTKEGVGLVSIVAVPRQPAITLTVDALAPVARQSRIEDLVRKHSFRVTLIPTACQSLHDPLETR